MKKLVSIVSALVVVCAGCSDNGMVKQTYRYQVNEPVFMNMDEFREQLSFTEMPQPIEQQGKICFYKDYLYISEPDKGIHIVDNRDPSNPVRKGFVELAGNHDIAVKNDLLYADAMIDLVWFDLSDPAKPAYEGRLENVFMSALPPCENGYGYDYGAIAEGRNQNKVVVGWSLTERVEVYEVPKGDLMYDASNSAGGSSGVNGSFSLFSIYQNYLYTIIESELTIFDLSSASPSAVAREPYIGKGWQIETVFNYEDNLFMGTPQGMLIYSLKNPLKPEYHSQFNHIYGCDPVVVEDGIAYVTIRSGTACGQNANLLYVIDVKDTRDPRELYAYDMVNPKGVGIDNKTLFVCDEGLKIYNAEDPLRIDKNMLAHKTGMNGFDIIPYKNVLMMIADGAIYQYDYSDTENIKELSKLSFK